MYNIGEYISYGNNGVCEIVGTETMDSSMENMDSRQCYMRKLISKEETRQLLDDIPEIETLPEQSARQQEIAYQKALHSGDCREWICLIKTLNERITTRKRKGKKVTATDDRYYKAASEKLIEEFSVVLGIDKGETKELLINAFGQ